ncbi:hypothetical protein PIB30_011521 [Stylosanthes scabra]|uniref:F-box protein n=1 Tax=Stylosanthes scabra TaxID=79078 RepID=A0ABU6T5M3_9FABA|nr:hypothetical protein [Stylosanthes scabra]
MTDQSPLTKFKTSKRTKLSYMGDDILFKIFVKCHPKTVGRLKTLNKQWRDRLHRSLFARLNWKENDEHEQSLVPAELEDYGYFSIIGSDRGNICLRYSKSKQGIELMVWNPLTKVVAPVDDLSYKYWGYNIGWGGLFNTHPSHLIGFSLEDATVFQDEIPSDKIRDCHAITKLNKGLAFVAYMDVGERRELEVWSIGAPKIGPSAGRSYIIYKTSVSLTAQQYYMVMRLSPHLTQGLPCPIQMMNEGLRL